MYKKKTESQLPPKLPPLNNNFKGSHLDINKLLKLKEDLVFENKNGSRRSLVFEKKSVYTHEEVVQLLIRLDNLWEEGTKKYDYIM